MPGHPIKQAQERGFPPRIIYKYTDQSGVEKILSNRTLRFARPSEMNDPFDVDADDYFGTDDDMFLYAREAFTDAYLQNPPF